MDQGTIAILGALAGATVAIGPNILLEAYKRRRERKGVASALAGEIASILWMNERRKYVEMYERALEQLDANRDVRLPNILHTEPRLDPVLEKHLDKIGMLGSNIPERVVRFYHVLMGLRIDVINLARAEPGDVEWKRNLIREDLAIWHEAVCVADVLVQELLSIAKPRWLGLW